MNLVKMKRMKFKVSFSQDTFTDNTNALTEDKICGFVPEIETVLTVRVKKEINFF